jgi:hypothetical protein
MGLWLKCPKCQRTNPLSLKACSNCGQDLDKLPAKERVYVIGPAEAPPAVPPPVTPAVVPAPSETLPVEPAAAEASAPSAEAGPAPKSAKKARRVKKKKT